MKNILLVLSTIFIFASCGKYEKPFITFKSPEKRLMDKTWKLEKIVNGNGDESTPNQTFNFTIVGNDSIVTKTIDNVTYSGTWNWLPALEGKLDKQRIIIKMDNSLITKNIYDVKALTSRKMEMVDRGTLQKFFLTAQ